MIIKNHACCQLSVEDTVDTLYCDFDAKETDVDAIHTLLYFRFSDGSCDMFYALFQDAGGHLWEVEADVDEYRGYEGAWDPAPVTAERLLARDRIVWWDHHGDQYLRKVLEKLDG